MRSGTCGAAPMVMKTIMIIAAGAVVAAGTVAIIRAVRRRRLEAFEVMTEDDLVMSPVVVTEEIFVVTDDPDEPSTFTT